MKKVTVIIPCVKNGELLRRSVGECLNQGAEVIVVSEEDAPEGFVSERVRLLKTGAISMSAKRNLGVRECGTEFIAFIDSDAYPDRGWLENAVQELKADRSIGMVGGPELSMPEERGFERFAGLALKSSLLTGSFSVKKRRSPRQELYALSSCNLVMRKADFEAAGGMDEALFVAEDVDLSRRVAALGKRIFFVPNVVVFHKDRSFLPFLIQRYQRGVSAAQVIRSSGKKTRWELWLSPLFALFTLSGLLLPLLPLWGHAFVAGWSLYFTAIAFETINHSEAPKDYPGVFLMLFVGTLTASLASLLGLVGWAPDLKKRYRNANDA